MNQIILLSFLLFNPPETSVIKFQNVEIIVRPPKPDLYGGPSGKLPLPGVSLIKRFEGLYTKAYPDPLTRDDPITNGWGAIRKRDGSKWRLGERITKTQADELLIYQLEHIYLPNLEKIPGWEKLNVHQRGALLSFSYNLGENFYGDRHFRSITRLLDWRDFKHLRQTLILYRNPGTRVEEGLMLRRQTEAWVFLHGE